MKRLLTLSAALTAFATSTAMAQSLALEYMTASLSTEAGDTIDAGFINIGLKFNAAENFNYMPYLGYALDPSINGASLTAGDSSTNILGGVRAEYDFYSTEALRTYATADFGVLFHTFENATTDNASLKSYYGAGVGAAYSLGSGSIYGELGLLGGEGSARLGGSFSF